MSDYCEDYKYVPTIHEILKNHFQFIISQVINQDRINMQDVQHQSK